MEQKKNRFYDLFLHQKLQLLIVLCSPPHDAKDKPCLELKRCLNLHLKCFLLQTMKRQGGAVLFVFLTHHVLLDGLVVQRIWCTWLFCFFFQKKRTCFVRDMHHFCGDKAMKISQKKDALIWHSSFGTSGTCTAKYRAAFDRKNFFSLVTWAASIFLREPHNAALHMNGVIKGIQSVGVIILENGVIFSSVLKSILTDSCRLPPSVKSVQG